MEYHLSKVEQEVVITFNAGEDTADFYTADPVWIRKLDRPVEQNPEQFKPEGTEKYNGKVVAKRYTIPKRFISVRSKAVKRELTEEQRAEIGQRLNKAR